MKEDQRVIQLVARDGIIREIIPKLDEKRKRVLTLLLDEIEQELAILGVFPEKHISVWRRNQL